MALTPEGKIKKKLCAILNEHNLYYFMPATGGFGRSGIPDVVGMNRSGIMFGIECKAEGGKPTSLQMYELNRIVEGGGYGVVYDGTVRTTWLLEAIGIYREE